MIEQVYFENFHLSNLRMEAILLNMFYGSSSAESTSDTPPAFRDIHIENVICESAGTAVVVRGLPEQPVERVSIQDSDLRSDAGILCLEASDLTLKNIHVIAKQEPLFSVTNVSSLQTADLTLVKIKN